MISARLQLCRPSPYLPPWWECGKHDRDLLIGAARHGLSRTDFYILNDPQLSFLDSQRTYVRGHHSHFHPQSHHHPSISASSFASSSPSSPSSLPPPLPHCCLYEQSLMRHSPHPPEYPHHAAHHQQHQHQPIALSVPSPSSSSASSHLHPTPLDGRSSASPGLGIVPGSQGDFLDCPALDETIELGSLHHDAMSADALHSGKASKDTLNGFPFNSAAGGQSMLNSYGVGGADLDSKLRSDVLVGEQGFSEETGLMAPSVELDQLQVRTQLVSARARAPSSRVSHVRWPRMRCFTEDICGRDECRRAFLNVAILRSSACFLHAGSLGRDGPLEPGPPHVQ